MTSRPTPSTAPSRSARWSRATLMTPSSHGLVLHTFAANRVLPEPLPYRRMKEKR